MINDDYLFEHMMSVYRTNERINHIDIKPDDIQHYDNDVELFCEDFGCKYYEQLLETNHVDNTYENVINLICDVFRNYELEKDIYYTGYLYDDTTKKVYYNNLDKISKDIHPIFIDLRYEDSSKFGAAVEWRDKVKSPNEYGLLDRTVSISKEELEHMSEPLIVFINSNTRLSDKAIRGNLWHEFNHLKKQFVKKNHDLLKTKKYSIAYSRDKIIDDWGQLNNSTLSFIEDFLYSFSPAEQDANVQMFGGLLKNKSISEIEEICNMDIRYKFLKYDFVQDNAINRLIFFFDDEYDVSFRMLKKSFDYIKHKKIDFEYKAFMLISGYYLRKHNFIPNSYKVFSYNFIKNALYDKTFYGENLDEINSGYECIYNTTKKSLNKLYTRLRNVAYGTVMNKIEEYNK